MEEHDRCLPDLLVMPSGFTGCPACAVNELDASARACARGTQLYLPHIELKSIASLHAN